MKLNIAYPAMGTQKMFEIVDERKLHVFYEKRIGDEIDGSLLGQQFEGYTLQITGGCDKQGFPMSNALLSRDRAKLLLVQGDTGYRASGRVKRKRKTVRGCIVTQDIASLAMIVITRGSGEIEGLTDKSIPRSLGPKRASKIRRMFGLSLDDDVRDFVIGQTVPATKEGAEPRRKVPKIQRLMTQEKLELARQRKQVKAQKKEQLRKEAEAYAALLQKRGIAAKK